MAAAHLQTSLLGAGGVSEGGVTIRGASDVIAAVVRVELAVLRIALEKKRQQFSWIIHSLGIIHLSYQEARHQTDKKEDCDKEKFFHYEFSVNTLRFFLD